MKSGLPACERVQTVRPAAFEPGAGRERVTSISFGDYVR